MNRKVRDIWIGWKETNQKVGWEDDMWNTWTKSLCAKGSCSMVDGRDYKLLKPRMKQKEHSCDFLIQFSEHAG
jgi:hypothetical protein